MFLFKFLLTMKSTQQTNQRFNVCTTPMWFQRWEQRLIRHWQC